MVTAKKVGTATITGIYKSIKFKCKITVQNIKKLNKLLYSGEYGKLWLKEINSNGLVMKFKNTTKKDIWLYSEYFVLDYKQLEYDNDVLPGTDYWVVFNELDMIIPEEMTREGLVYLRAPSVKTKIISGYIRVMEKKNDGGYDIGKILIKNVKLQ